MLDGLNKTIYFGNSVREWITAIFVFIVVLIVIAIARKVVENRLKKLEATVHKDFIASIITSFRQRLLPITYVISVYVALEFIKLPAIHIVNVGKGLFLFVSFFVLLFASDLVKIVLLHKKGHDNHTLPVGVVTFARILLWAGGILFIFSNLGYDVSTLVTGLGIGGVAIALASQNILGDLFNYFVILFDKPFNVGDYVRLDTAEGTIENIGIKSTKVRSINGELLIISNTELTKSRISNFVEASKRRNLSVIGVEYSTSTENLKNIPSMLRECVESVEMTEFSRVHFAGFGSSSLNFELAYFVKTNEYRVYVSTVQEVNYKILESLRAKGISFAFPTQTIHVNSL